MKKAGVSGLTLIEMNVAIILLAVIMTAVLGIYGAVASLWERTSTQNDSQMMLGEAAGRLTSALRDGCHIVIFTRFTTNDTVVITYPRDSTPEGDFSPTKSGAQPTYKKSDDSRREIWYLSNSSGSITSKGDILWVASTSEDDDDAADLAEANEITPDSTRSLLPGTRIGQVAPVTALRIDPPSNGDPAWYYKVTVANSEKRGSQSALATLTRRVYVRNHE